jgi:uncharacterized iron-regulated membrane protein
MSMIRRIFVWLHRWVGLAMAGFLVVVGLTGGLLAFLPELSHWLAPQLYPGAHGETLDASALARHAEHLFPEARANTVYLGTAGTAWIGMEPLPGATPLAFNRLVLDAVTGEELGRLERGALPTTLEEIMPFVYSLHYQLAMGPTGEWILGIVALAWTIDCFVAFYLTLPPPSPASRRNVLARWAPSWLVRWRASTYRINFDLHRAGGLWLFPLLLVFAWSSVFFNLNEVYIAATKLVLEIEPPAWTWPAQTPRADGRAMLGWADAEATGTRLMADQARLHGFTILRRDALYFHRQKGLVQYRVRSSRDIGDKYGTTSVLFDAYTGELVAIELPTGQRSGTTLTTWLTALHMANLFGLPYRILVCVAGLVIAMLSATGVYIWWKKRRARRLCLVRAGASTPHASDDALVIRGPSPG